MNLHFNMTLQRCPVAHCRSRGFALLGADVSSNQRKARKYSSCGKRNENCRLRAYRRVADGTSVLPAESSAFTYQYSKSRELDVCATPKKGKPKRPDGRIRPAEALTSV